MQKQSKTGKKRSISLKQLLCIYLALVLLIIITIWNVVLGFAFALFCVALVAAMKNRTCIALSILGSLLMFFFS